VPDNFLNLSELGTAFYGTGFFKFFIMNIKLTKPLIFFDLETTGLSITKDKICQISFTKFFPQEKSKKKQDAITKTRVINPEMDIPQAAIDIHGITNEEAKKAATFDQIATSLHGFFQGCDIAGYNIKRFDLQMLRENFLKLDMNFPDPKASIVDVFQIVQEIIPRNLSAMYKLMTGMEPHEAHNAEYDNMMCIDILTQMMNPKAKFNIEPHYIMKGIDTVEDLHDLCASEETTVDYARKIIINPKTEEYELNFGNHRGDRILDHKAYCLWMLSHDFTEDTKQHILDIWRRSKKELK